jgi:hypothetical protein
MASEIKKLDDEKEEVKKKAKEMVVTYKREADAKIASLEEEK